MAVCPKCGTIQPDECKFCVQCGKQLRTVTVNHAAAALQNRYQQAGWEQRGRYPETERAYGEKNMVFDPADISQNKVICVFMYLNGFLGLLAALLTQDSPFVRFHLRQSLKITVVHLVGTIALTFLFLFAAGIFYVLGRNTGSLDTWIRFGQAAGGIYGTLLVFFHVFLLVLRVMCIVHVCRGTAEEVPLLCQLQSLR